MAKYITETLNLYSYVRSKTKVEDVVGPLEKSAGEYVTEWRNVHSFKQLFSNSLFAGKCSRRFTRTEEGRDHTLSEINFTRERITKRLRQT